MEQLEYKCPCCGGAIAFDSELQKLKCPYCDTEFDVEALKAYDEDLKSEGGNESDLRIEENEWTGAEADGMRVYICNSCGGEIIGDENTAATTCPYCGNPVALMGKLKGELRPDLVIPFKVTKEQAKAALKKHFSGKRLLPKAFANENHLDEIKGIYVPFWLFDAEADADVRYKAVTTECWSDSKYNYTKTNFFSLFRKGTLDFSGVPVDGSSKMADDLMESIEPYDYSEAVDFGTAYLAGYFADKYDVTSENCITRANERMRKSTEAKFAETTAGYTGVVPETTNVRLGGGKSKYALLPVWVLTTSWQGKNYLFAMNAQTGKFVGDLPLDKAAYRRWLFGLTGAVGAAIMLITFLTYLF